MLTMCQVELDKNIYNLTNVELQPHLAKMLVSSPRKVVRTMEKWFGLSIKILHLEYWFYGYSVTSFEARRKTIAVECKSSQVQGVHRKKKNEVPA